MSADNEVSGREALRELLCSSAAYHGERAGLHPYVKDLMSWPASGSVPVDLETGLDQADQERLRGWQCSMLRDFDDAEKIRTELGLERSYCDPALFKSPK
eukprot:8343240-Karenia_brevis.AAC.1